jgi:hypothetical protein
VKIPRELLTKEQYRLETIKNTDKALEELNQYLKMNYYEKVKMNENLTSQTKSK